MCKILGSIARINKREEGEEGEGSEGREEGKGNENHLGKKLTWVFSWLKASPHTVSRKLFNFHKLNFPHPQMNKYLGNLWVLWGLTMIFHKNHLSIIVYEVFNSSVNIILFLTVYIRDFSFLKKTNTKSSINTGCSWVILITGRNNKYPPLFI